jgi:hypothetical protein
MMLLMLLGVVVGVPILSLASKRSAGAGDGTSAVRDDNEESSVWCAVESARMCGGATTISRKMMLLAR